MTSSLVHRFIPNSAPGVREEMLAEIGIESVDEIYEEIPEAVRFTGSLDLPAAGLPEAEIVRRVGSLLARNRTTSDFLSFLGAGCWPHYSPAIVREVIGRSEFLTSYHGLEVTDHGRFLAIFEYQSMMADLLEMDVVGAAVYDGSTAAGDAIQMASRITGRRELLVPRLMDPERLAVLRNYAGGWLEILPVQADPARGTLDLDDLRARVSGRTAAVYVENPAYLGAVETGCAEIAEIAHAAGALFVVGVNPASLGVLASPGSYGADIVCGDGQPLGLPQSAGAMRLGILACRNEPRLVHALPMLMVGVLPTIVPGERAYTWHTMFDHIFYGERESARSFSGSSSFLAAIAAAVHLATLGPRGMVELGRANMQKAAYAARRLGALPGLRAPLLEAPFFNEFLVGFEATGLTVAEVNAALRRRGILGGKDVSGEFPALGQSALYCVTEQHSLEDIERLVAALGEVAG